MYIQDPKSLKKNCTGDSKEAFFCHKNRLLKNNRIGISYIFFTCYCCLQCGHRSKWNFTFGRYRYTNCREGLKLYSPTYFTHLHKQKDDFVYYSVRLSFEIGFEEKETKIILGIWDEIVLFDSFICLFYQPLNVFRILCSRRCVKSNKLITKYNSLAKLILSFSITVSFIELKNLFITSSILWQDRSINFLINNFEKYKTFLHLKMKNQL